MRNKVWDEGTGWEEEWVWKSCHHFTFEKRVLGDARVKGTRGDPVSVTLPTCGPSLITPKGQRRDPTQFKAKED